MNSNITLNKRKTLLATFVAMFAAGATTQGAMAQTEQWLLEEIVVTAEKRSASIQEVPISITAFSGDELVTSGIDDSRDLEMVTPGLVFTNNAGVGIVSIRGIGSPFAQGPGFDPSSSVYVDGVYQSRFTSSVLGLMDLERVEVLKGPQGTLYGRNSVGGAVNYISQAPSTEFGGDVSIQVGNYNLREAKLRMDIPIAEDLLFRGALMNVDRDGFTTNLGNGSDLEEEDSFAGRMSLHYIPSDSFEAIMHASFSDRSGAVNPGKKHLFIDPDGPLAAAESLDDPRTVRTDQVHHSSSESQSASLTLKWDLGSTKLTSISAYIDQTVGPYASDFDVTELPIVHIGTLGRSDNGLGFDTQSFSQEFLLASQGDSKLEWLTGIYYLHENAFGQSGTHLPGIDFHIQNFATNITDAYAAFGHVVYSLSDELRLSLGLRYSYEEKDFTHEVHINSSNVAGPRNRTVDWNSWTPKISIDYSFNDDLMGYLSASRGFKSGGFNAFGGIDDPVVDPEYLDAIEIGLKTTLMDGRMVLNGSIFDYDFSDMQVITVDTSAGIAGAYRNAGEAEIRGMEIELSALLSQGFQLDVGLSWLDAEFVDFETGGTNLRGNKVPNSPEFTANVGVKYSQSIGSWGNVQMVADYYYSDEIFNNEFNDVSWTAGSYDLLNLRLTLEPNSGSWQFALFGKNVTDELVLELPYNFPAFLGDDALLAHLGPPRTYGAEFTYKF